MADIRALLQDIYQDNGRLTPALVVAAARDDGHPLHHRFEWDDDVAAERYRQVQAAELIRKVRVKYGETPKGEVKDVRAWQSVYSPDVDGTDSTYMPVEDVAADPLLRQMVLRTAEREWKQMHRRYGHLKEFLAVVREDVA